MLANLLKQLLCACSDETKRGVEFRHLIRNVQNEKKGSKVFLIGAERS